MSVRILVGDCRRTLRELPDASVDSCVCDPPYHLQSIVKRFGAENAAPVQSKQTGVYARSSKGFMGQTWDGGDVAFDPDTWAEVLRVLKPGGHLVAFSGTRTYHRMVCAIEDAGFEVRDQLAWIYGSGFPKSHDVSKGIDKMAGAEREVVAEGAPIKRMIPGADQNKKGWKKDNGREFVPTVTAPATEAAKQWQGWGTALKPSWEPICLARKPLIGTVAQNVLAHGTGALNIDGCRVETADDLNGGAYSGDHRQRDNYSSTDTNADAPLTRLNRGIGDYQQPLGRWPANLCHDGSDEVLAGFPEEAGSNSTDRGRGRNNGIFGNLPTGASHDTRANGGSAARFFYCAKATTEERGEGNNHPTVKPVALMRWLTRLVTPKGGIVLDPFMGSGSTAIACQQEGFSFVGCELSADYVEIARRRLLADSPLFAEVEVVHSSPSTRAA